MSPISGGTRYPAPTQYLFIDGAYLREVLGRMSDRYFGGTPLELNYDRIGDRARKVFYYDCLPGRKDGESDADFSARVAKQQAHFDILKSQRGWHVQLGTVKGEGNRLRQKQVDTMLSVDMLAHSYRRNASEIALIAGDLDFKPAVDALVQDGMYVILCYDTSHVSKELMSAADDRRPMNIQTIRGWIKDEFSKRFLLPQLHATPSDEVREWAQIKKGVLEDGRDVGLFKGPDKYAAVFDEGINPGYRMYVQSTSIDLIEKCVEDVFSKITWRKPGV